MLYFFAASESSGSTVEINCTRPEICVSPAHIRSVDIDIVPATNTVHSSPNPASMDPSSSSCDSQTNQMVCDLVRDMVEDALNRVRVLQPSDTADGSTQREAVVCSHLTSFFKKIYEVFSSFYRVGRIDTI